MFQTNSPCVPSQGPDLRIRGCAEHCAAHRKGIPRGVDNEEPIESKWEAKPSSLKCSRVKNTALTDLR